MQVTSAVLAGMVWALENPNAGIVEADEMDFRRCLEVQTPYLGPVVGVYTDWTPLDEPPGPVPRGHRRERSLAVPQRAGAVRWGAPRPGWRSAPIIRPKGRRFRGIRGLWAFSGRPL